jgi:hypothetical protein
MIRYFPCAEAAPGHHHPHLELMQEDRLVSGRVNQVTYTRLLYPQVV